MLWSEFKLRKPCYTVPIHVCHPVQGNVTPQSWTRDLTGDTDIDESSIWNRVNELSNVDCNDGDIAVSVARPFGERHDGKVDLFKTDLTLTVLINPCHSQLQGSPLGLGLYFIDCDLRVQCLN